MRPLLLVLLGVLLTSATATAHAPTYKAGDVVPSSLIQMCPMPHAKDFRPGTITFGRDVNLWLDANLRLDIQAADPKGNDAVIVIEGSNDAKLYARREIVLLDDGGKIAGWILPSKHWPPCDDAVS